MKKRIIALILTLSLVLSMGINVFAADSMATITITDEDGNVRNINGTIILTEEGSGKTVEELEAELEELEYLNSSYGFFVWLSENDSITEAQREDAARAAEVLLGTADWEVWNVKTPGYNWYADEDYNVTYAQLLEVFEIGEMTSTMENFILGIQVVIACNEVRQEENEYEGTELEDLLINPIMMACEELQLNYTIVTEDTNHSLTFSVKENLAYGNITIDGAFDLWYWAESVINGGHYKTIVNTDYEISGAAVYMDGTYGYYGQAFHGGYGANFGFTENAYTTDEFYALALEYQEEIEADIEAVEVELEGLEEITVKISNGKADVDVSDGTYTATISGLDGHGTYVTTVTVSDGAVAIALSNEDADSLFEHDYEEETTDATCDEDGKTVYTCSICGDSYTEIITATGHSYDDGVVTTEPTCTEEGVITYTCETCGDTYTESIDASGHDYVLSRIEKEATCTEDGLAVYTCSVCGETYEDIIEAFGHTEGEAVTDNVVDPTCTEDGSYDSVVYCTVCGEELSRETVAVEATGHSYEAVVTDPTCTEKGYTTYTCSVCGDSYTSDETDALGHSYDDGVVTTEPTCTEEGVITYTCEVCGDTYTESIEVNGHVYVFSEYYTSASGNLTAIYVCENCGEASIFNVEEDGTIYDNDGNLLYDPNVDSDNNSVEDDDSSDSNDTDAEDNDSSDNEVNDTSADNGNNNTDGSNSDADSDNDNLSADNDSADNSTDNATSSGDSDDSNAALTDDTTNNTAEETTEETTAAEDEDETTTSDDGAAATGDTNRVFFWMTLAVLAAIGGAISLRTKFNN